MVLLFILPLYDLYTRFRLNGFTKEEAKEILNYGVGKFPEFRVKYPELRKINQLKKQVAIAEEEYARRGSEMRKFLEKKNSEFVLTDDCIKYFEEQGLEQYDKNWPKG
jgi:ribosomal protein L15E